MGSVLDRPCCSFAIFQRRLESFFFFILFVTYIDIKLYTYIDFKVEMAVPYIDAR